MGIQKKDEHTMAAFAHNRYRAEVLEQVCESTARESYVGGVNFFLFLLSILNV